MLARENRGSFVAIYIAKVRVTVHADGSTTIREGHGTGEGRGPLRVRSMTSHSKRQRPMPPNGRWLHLENPSVWRSMQAEKLHPP